MTASAIEGGDKRDGIGATWTEVKFDRQIVAVAKVKKISTIYSDDKILKKFAAAQGILVIGVGELPMPPEDAQGAFAWDVVHDDDKSEDE